MQVGLCFGLKFFTFYFCPLLFSSICLSLSSSGPAVLFATIQFAINICLTIVSPSAVTTCPILWVIAIPIMDNHIIPLVLYFFLSIQKCLTSFWPYMLFRIIFSKMPNADKFLWFIVAVAHEYITTYLIILV